MKKVTLLLSTVLLLLSCSSEETDYANTENKKSVEVVKISNVSTTRSSTSSSELTNKVLKFRDETSYETIKKQLENMDEAHRKE